MGRNGAPVVLLASATALGLGLGIADGRGADVPEELAEHVSFHLSFDRSLAPDRARGSDRVVARPPEGAIAYIPGVKGQAALGKDKVKSLFYVMKGNLDFSRPGSVSLWFNPLGWAVQTPETPVQGKTRWKKTFTAGFFGAAYSPDGYIVLQRCTSQVPGDAKDVLMLLFPCMKGYRSAGRRTSVAVVMKAWHHLALTWNGITYRVYLDGKEIMWTDVPAKIGMDRLGGYFNVHMARGLAFDEFLVFDEELTAAEVAGLGGR